MIIKYSPTEVKNTAKFLNEMLEKYSNEKYIMFIFNDIYENIIDVNEFYNKYILLMKKFNLPFSFYPYYIHFNKVLPRTLSMGVSKMKVKINKEPECDVVSQTAYGMFLIDVEKLKSINFKFNEVFTSSFYVQEYIEVCYKNKFYYSTHSFLDVYDSFKMLKSSFKDGYFIDAKKFAEEKTKFYSIYKQDENKESIQDFIKTLKDECQKVKEKYSNSVKLVEPLEDVITVDYNDIKETI